MGVLNQHNSDSASTSGHNSWPASLQKLVRAARFVLYLEKLWPRLVVLAIILGLFLTFSFAGLWLWVSSFWRMVVLLGFGLALLVSLWQIARLRLPAPAKALARLDADSGLPHQPASTLAAALASSQPGNDSIQQNDTTTILWQLHQARLQAYLRRLTPRPPKPNMMRRDPWALRIIVLFATLTTAFLAGEDAGPRVMAAFQGFPVFSINASQGLYAWVEPPSYTGLEPIILQGPDKSARAGDDAEAQGGGKLLSVPQDSLVIVSANDLSRYHISASEGLVPVVEPKNTDAKSETQSQQLRWRVEKSGILTVSWFGFTLARFDFKAEADIAPTIAFITPPEQKGCCALSLQYKTNHAYGVTSVVTQATLLQDAPRKSTHPMREKPLFSAPNLPLPVPASNNGVGEALAKPDFSAHPWAGLPVLFALKATDGAGKSGATPNVQLTLPERRFSNGLARALIEQRKTLIIAPLSHHHTVLAALDAFMIDPEEFGTSAGLYLGLSLVRTRITDGLNLFEADNQAPAREKWEEAANLLWDIALTLEGGVDPQTQQNLADAQKALQDAIKRHAPPDEIAKLMQNLREAMQKYLQEMAKNSAKDKATQGDQAQAQTKTITPEQLEDMLKQMQKYAESGDMKAAKDLMDQLADILNNLRSGSDGQQQSGKNPLASMDRKLRELDGLMREEQDLRDETYQEEQKSGAGRGRKSSPPNGEQQKRLKDLAERQKGLQDKLQQLEQDLKGSGLPDSHALDDAQSAMGEAGKSLQEGRRDGSASGSEGQALDALRQGLQDLQGERDALAKMLKQQGGDGGEPGAQQEGQNGYGRDGQNDGTGGEDSNSPLNEGQRLADRARRIFEEIGRRLSKPDLPKAERNYLERLLERYH